jgi:hypothetical protein
VKVSFGVNRRTGQVGARVEVRGVDKIIEGPVMRPPANVAPWVIMVARGLVRSGLMAPEGVGLIATYGRHAFEPLGFTFDESERFS